MLKFLKLNSIFILFFSTRQGVFAQHIKIAPFKSGETVCELNNGNYQLKINYVTIGNFTDAELKHGVNRANYGNTPHYVQSLAIKQTQFLDQLKNLNLQAHAMNKPQTYHYSIVKVYN